MSVAHNIGAGALRNWATGELPTVKAPQTHTLGGLPPFRPGFRADRFLEADSFPGRSRGIGTVDRVKNLGSRNDGDLSNEILRAEAPLRFMDIG